MQGPGLGEDLDVPGDERGEVERHQLERQVAGLDPRHLQQVGDQPLQPPDLLVHDPVVLLAGLRRVLARAEHQRVDEPLERRERVAKLV